MTEEFIHKSSGLTEFDVNSLTDAYAFLMDFLETFTKEASELMKRNQKLMRSLFEALKSNEKELDNFISQNFPAVS